MVAIEAQARGTKVVCSNNVPREAKISDGIIFEKNFDKIKWVKDILVDSQGYEIEKTLSMNYDICSVCLRLEKHNQSQE